MGKGDFYRKVKGEKYRSNWDDIFKKPKPKKENDEKTNTKGRR
jgi:hypothetical protein